MKLTNEKIQSNTRFSTNYYERTKKDIAAYEADQEKTHRLKEQECKTCYYLKGGVIAGDAMTSYKCRHCEKENWHENNHPPRYCKNCAASHEVCVRCGASVN